MKNFFTRFRSTPRLIKFLAVHMFFDGFVPIVSLYPIMFSRVGGLNLEQIGTLFALWSLAYVVCELPSGVLADFWSRKWVVFASGILRALGFAIWIIWPNFTGYAIGFVLWGATIACWSGAATAYLHNELRAINQEDKFAKYFGYLMSINTVGKLAGLLVAAVLTLRHTNLLLGLSIVSSLLLSAALLPLPEHPYKKQLTYLKTLAAGFKEVARSPRLRYLCVVLFSVFMTIGVLEELLPRVYAHFGLNDTAVSLVIGASVLVAIVLLAKLEWVSRFSLRKQVMLLAGGLVALLAGLYLRDISGTALVVLFALVFELFRPVFIHHVTDAAQGDERATIGSIPGLYAGVLGAGAYVVMGWLAERTTEHTSYGIYGAFWLIAFLILAYMGKRYWTPKHKQELPSDGSQPVAI